MYIKSKLFFLFLLLTGSLVAQQSPTILAYIETYKELAMDEMRRTGVPATIKLAQGIHETLAGTSALVQKSNNHFGIKCKSNWTGESVSHDDDARGECFRKYPSATDSYRDHSDFLKNSQRYAGLFQLDPADYAGWANGLKKAGYATNPKYPQVLIKLIEDYNLQQYTQLVLQGKKIPLPVPDTAVAAVPATAVPEIQKTAVDYPSGEFRINQTRVILAAKGTSYLSIANKYQLPLARIFEFNELQATEAVDTDRLIFLQRKRKTGAVDRYTVKPGETLYSIAQEQGIRLESLCELNLLQTGDRPAPGEQLNLKTKTTRKPKLVLRENYSLYQAGTHSLH